MKTAKAEGGKPVSVRLDAASLARLQYLEAFYRMQGVQASNSAIVRRALSALVEEASNAVLRHREDAQDGRVVLAAKRLVWDAENNGPPCPWRDGLPALDDAKQFPTWKELQAPSKAKAAALVPLPTIDESITDE